MSESDTPGTPPPQPEPSLLDLIADLWAQTSTQVQGEVALAKAEFRQKLRQAIRGVALIFFAAILVMLALATLVSAIVALVVSLGIPPAAAGFLVGVGLVIVACLLLWLGLCAVNPRNLVMRRTTANLRRDKTLLTKGRVDDQELQPQRN